MTHCIIIVNKILLIAMQYQSDTCYIASDMAKPGRPRKGKELKKPSDYPQYVFRVSKGDYERLERLLDEALELSNKKREPGEREYTKSALIALAVFKGLEVVKRQLKS